MTLVTVIIAAEFIIGFAVGIAFTRVFDMIIEDFKEENKNGKNKNGKR